MSAPGGRPAAREQYVGTGLARLYVRDIGADQPIIVLHGGPDFDHEYLLPELDALADTFRLVYYDQRGRGRSFAEQGPDDVSITTEIEDLDRIRGHFGFDRVAVLGHSWGGLLATEYAIHRPARVSHLILMNTAPLSYAGLVAFRDHLQSSRSPEQLVRMSALRSSPEYAAGDIDADLAYYRIHFASALRRPEQLDRVLPRLRSAFTSDSVVAARAIEDRLYAQTWDADDYDLLPPLTGLGVPSLVIHGDSDLVPVGIAREIAQAIPRSRFVVLNDCGHFAYLEQPDAVRAHLAALFAQGVGGQPPGR